MMKVYTNNDSVTIRLYNTEWDAVRYYVPKMLRKLNNQVKGCVNFGIHAPGQDPYDIKGTVFENMRMPNEYTYVQKFDGIDITYEEAVEKAQKVILDEYHSDLRHCKRVFINAMFRWLGEIEDAMETESNEVFEEQYPVEEHIDTTTALERIHEGAKTFAKNVGRLADDIHETALDINAIIDAAPKAMKDAIAKASTIVSSDVEDEDDDEIEGDLVTEGSNFSTREPLTEKDEDDYTDDDDTELTEEDEEALDPDNEVVEDEDGKPLLIYPDEVTHSDDRLEDDEVDEADPNDLL